MLHDRPFAFLHGRPPRVANILAGNREELPSTIIRAGSMARLNRANVVPAMTRSPPPTCCGESSEDDSARRTSPRDTRSDPRHFAAGRCPRTRGRLSRETPANPSQQTRRFSDRVSGTRISPALPRQHRQAFHRPRGPSDLCLRQSTQIRAKQFLFPRFLALLELGIPQPLPRKSSQATLLRRAAAPLSMFPRHTTAERFKARIATFAGG